MNCSADWASVPGFVLASSIAMMAVAALLMFAVSLWICWSEWSEYRQRS